MVQNYQDAMAICRWTRYPNVFVTFTCNPQWPEIKRPQDQPDLVTQVFIIKLKELRFQMPHAWKMANAINNIHASSNPRR